MITKQLKNLAPFWKMQVKSLHTESSNIILRNTTNLSDPVEIAIKNFENHLSVQIIQKNIL